MRGPVTALILMALLAAGAAAAGGPAVYAVAYHDVRDDLWRSGDADEYAVSSLHLAAHFDWLRRNGYTPVSVDDILAARAGRQTLPDRAVLLSFDDGLRSVYTHVFPLLKLFGYPAVVSPVTAWLDSESAEVDYEGRRLSRSDFLTWDEIREMQGSGLVEIASHSHDLHRGVRGNPQGNEQPAAVTRLFDGEAYEDDAAYAARLRADLARSAEIIQARTGQEVRVITWPYGEYNETGRAIAAALGMALSLSLSPAQTDLDGPTPVVGRELPVSNPATDRFAGFFLSPDAPVLRAAQVDLDAVYDPDPAQQEANLGRLLDRVQALGLTHVFLQAFADPDGNGAADALYFPSRQLPMRGDLFNRAAWQLRTRAGVTVYAWLPLLAYAGAGVDPHWQVLQEGPGGPAPDPAGEPRLSVFDPAARAWIRTVYEDLGRHAAVEGVHFHDDGRLSELEDASPAALAAARAEFGPAFSIAAARDDEALGRAWSDLKARQLTAFSLELAEAVRAYRPRLRTSRNLFASALLDPSGPLYLAQDFDNFLAAYDHVTLMAMPGLEGAADEDQFYADLVEAVRRRPDGLLRTVFQLQTVDWRTGRRLAAAAVADRMAALQAAGVRNLAYYPDDFIAGQPELADLRRGISAAKYPRRIEP
jgi:biofilm PGA synthesis lipoprotein PgaB